MKEFPNMNPILDQLLVGALIAGALAFFVFRTFRRRQKGCGGGCGCAGSKEKGLAQKPNR